MTEEDASGVPASSTQGIPAGEGRAGPPAGTAPPGAPGPGHARLVEELRIHETELKEILTEELTRAQAELDEVRFVYDDLFDFAPVGYFTVDPEGSILRVNFAGASLLGAPPSRLLGRNLGSFLDEACRPAFLGFLSDVLAGRPAGPCDVAVRSGTADPVFAELLGRREAGSSACRVAMTDVTALKEAEEALLRSEADVERLRCAARPGGDAAGTPGELDGLGPLAARAGREAAEVRRDAAELQRDAAEVRRDAAEIRRDAAEGQRDATEVRRDAAEIRRDASRVDRESDRSDRLTARVARDSADLDRDAAEARRQAAESERDSAKTERDAAKSERDAAQRQRDDAEARLRQLNEELEERVRVRTAQLEAANREIDAFSYSVSHDLRSPLRAIDGFVRLLSSCREGEASPEEQRLTAVIVESVARMNRLIEGLLNFARTSRSPLHRVAVDMKGLVEPLLEELVPPAERGRTLVKVSDLPAAEGDPDLLRIVWRNLLANALKFSAGRTLREVEAGFATSDSGTVYFVRDNGAGFDPKYAAKLFGPFQRLHSAKDFPGTGIGLSIVRRIVERHGGRAWAEGEPGRGATFSFTLDAPSSRGEEGEATA